LASRASFALEVPELRSRVTDLADVLSVSEERQLTERLAAIEANEGKQFAVLTLTSLEGEAIEDFGIRVVEKWQLGAKGVDDGLLVLVAKNDRRMRIEVGYGLEGAIPDALAGRVIRDVMAPEFRNGNYYAGIDQAVSYLERAAAGEAVSPPRRSNDDADDGFPFFAFLIFPLFWLLPLLSRRRSRGAFFTSAALYGATRHHGHRRGFGGGGFGGGGFSGGGGGFGGGGASGGW
jgi:uncharacterized protein